MKMKGSSMSELRDAGTYGYWELTKRGGKAVRQAFSP